MRIKWLITPIVPVTFPLMMGYSERNDKSRRLIDRREFPDDLVSDMKYRSEAASIAHTLEHGMTGADDKR